MNGESALGLLEVYGLTAAVAVADQMAKAAPVELLARLEIGDGLVTVVARGGVSAVQEAVAVGRRTASTTASLRSSSVLGRPAPGVTELFFPAVVRSRSSAHRIRAPRTGGAQGKKTGGTSSG
ncbi:MAG TPA: BMC domain-containing protein [Candidatus Dormibacteraeota bacterium]|nr:BMC domain-containing protein [Candidatus Dormibacteraeota bacterium]